MVLRTKKQKKTNKNYLRATNQLKIMMIIKHKRKILKKKKLKKKIVKLNKKIKNKSLKILKKYPISQKIKC